MRLATAIDDKKGEEVRVLDLRGVCGFADYFVLATGTLGAPRAHARRHGDRRGRCAAARKPRGVEGKPVGALGARGSRRRRGARVPARRRATSSGSSGSGATPRSSTSRARSEPLLEERAARSCSSCSTASALGDGGPGDATALARAPFFAKLRARYPHAQIETSGAAVGLPDGQMGNSEVGHTTLGAGRIIDMDIVRIAKAIDAGELAAHARAAGAARRRRSARAARCT